MVAFSIGVEVAVERDVEFRKSVGLTLAHWGG